MCSILPSSFFSFENRKISWRYFSVSRWNEGKQQSAIPCSHLLRQRCSGRSGCLAVLPVYPRHRRECKEKVEKVWPAGELSPQYPPPFCESWDLYAVSEWRFFFCFVLVLFWILSAPSEQLFCRTKAFQRKCWIIQPRGPHTLTGARSGGPLSRN